MSASGPRKAFIIDHYPLLDFSVGMAARRIFRMFVGLVVEHLAVYTVTGILITWAIKWILVRFFCILSVTRPLVPLLYSNASSQIPKTVLLSRQHSIHSFLLTHQEETTTRTPLLPSQGNGTK